MSNGEGPREEYQTSPLLSEDTFTNGEIKPEQRGLAACRASGRIYQLSKSHRECWKMITKKTLGTNAPIDHLFDFNIVRPVNRKNNHDMQ